MNPGLSESIIAHLSLEDFFAFEGFSFAFEGFSFTPTAGGACTRKQIAALLILWYDADKSELHEPKHGKRKKRVIVFWKRKAH